MNPARNLFLFVLAFTCASAWAQVDKSKGGPIDPVHFQDRYVVQTADQNNLQFANDPAGTGRVVMRLTIGKNDRKVFGGIRSEIVARNEYIRTGVRWYAISFYVPPEWQDDPAPVIAFQLHTSQRDVVLSPPVAMLIRGRRLELELWANHRQIHGAEPALKENSARQAIFVADLEKSTWYCFVARADWSSTIGNGSFKLWLNGEKIYEAQNLHNAYETWLGNYPKVGLYAPGGLNVPAEQLYVDFIHLGGPRSSLSDMTSLTPCGNNAAGTVQ